jgi:hypothetical protein
MSQSSLNRTAYHQRFLRTVTFVSFLLILGGTTVSWGQSPLGANSRGNSQFGVASPYQQQLSPYLDLLRNDNSVLSPYHSFVRPRQQMQQAINQQSAELRQLRQLSQPGHPTGVSATRLQTGRGGSFNNFMHFYPPQLSR